MRRIAFQAYYFPVQAIIVFHDHRAAGFVHQAIQCGALHLSEKQEEVYVKFLQPEEVHRASRADSKE
jgi:hypothetical protein